MTYELDLKPSQIFPVIMYFYVGTTVSESLE